MFDTVKTAVVKAKQASKVANEQPTQQLVRSWLGSIYTVALLC
jgi:hypothetical protein